MHPRTHLRPPVVAFCALGLAVSVAVSVAVAAPEDPPPAKPAGTVPVEKFFRGKILKLDGANIEVLYDFQDPGQLLDFAPSLPFRAIRTVAFEGKGGKVALSGTGSMRHKAVFDGEVGASATFWPRRPRDFGFAVTEERESEVFTLYCCYDRYFGLGDNVTIPQNMIIKFLARDPKVNKEGLQDWRYCGSRGQKPEITVGKSYKVAIQRTGMESSLTIDDWESKGKETGRELTSEMVAVYLYDSQVEIDDLVVHGKLHPDFVQRNGIDLTTWKPAAAPPAPGPGAPPAAPEVSDAVTERVRATIAGYPLQTKPHALAALLRDAALPVALRTEAAEKAKENGSKLIVPFLVDGLDSKDPDARRLSADVLKGVLGKTFNYRPDGPEDARKKSIRDLNEYLKKHAAEFV